MCIRDSMEAVMKDPYILITDQKISNVQDIMPVLEAVSRAGKGLLIICLLYTSRCV